MEEHSSLACSLWLAQLSVHHGTTCPGIQGSHYPQCERSSDINHQSRKCFIDVPTGQSDKGSSTKEALSSQGTLGYVQCTKKHTAQTPCSKIANFNSLLGNGERKVIPLTTILSQMYVLLIIDNQFSHTQSNYFFTLQLKASIENLFSILFSFTELLDLTCGLQGNGRSLHF